MITVNRKQSHISKRQFIKTGLMGIGGACCIAGSRLFDISDLYSEEMVLDPSRDLPGKFSKEAMFYTVVPRGVKCMICPNDCTIKEGETGDCRNRTNVKGKLYSIAYGNPCSANIDPIEKKPLYHFLPTTYAFSIATAGCNLACLNCQNWTISQASPLETDNYDLMPEAVVEEAVKRKCKSIAYTYSEPITFFEYTYDTAKLARKKGIKNVLVSAGYINGAPLRELAQYIDAANIDLKSFSDDIYLRLNGGTLQPVLDTLITLKDMHVWLEITNLVIPGWTDDFDMIRQMCQWLYHNGFSDFPLHFSRFYPQYKLTRLPATPLSTLEKARNIALDEGLKYVYVGNVSGTDAQHTYCPNCHRIVIERKGYRIISNSIVSGKCKYCNGVIHGHWA